jgi:hypothetical protein
MAYYTLIIMWMNQYYASHQLFEKSEDWLKKLLLKHTKCLAILAHKK